MRTPYRVPAVGEDPLQDCLGRNQDSQCRIVRGHYRDYEFKWVRGIEIEVVENIYKPLNISDAYNCLVN